MSGRTSGVATATDKYSRSTKNLNTKLVNTNRSLNAMHGLLGKIASAAAVISGIKLADDFNELQNKIRITVQEGEDLLSIQNKLVDTSLKTRSSLQENALLYLRLSNAVDRNVTSQDELFRITESVTKAVQIGGSSAQEAAGAVRQFTQIVSSGFSSGFSQEINSLSEQTPGLFKLIADGLRETSQEFRDLEEQGFGAVKILKIFSEEGIGDLDTLLKAIGSQAGVVDKQFTRVNVTVSKAIGNIKTALEEYIGKADDATGLTQKLAEKLNDIALNFDHAVDELKQFTIAATAAVATFVSLTIAVKAATLAMLLFRNGLIGTIALLLRVSTVARVFTPVGLAISAVSVYVGILVSKFVDFEKGLITVGSRITNFSGLMKAVFKTISQRFDLLSKNFAILRDNVSAVFSDIGDAVVGTFESIGIALESDDSSFAKFFLKTAPAFVKDFFNGLVKTALITSQAIAVFFANIVIDAEGAVEKLKLEAEKKLIEAQIAADKTKSKLFSSITGVLAGEFRLTLLIVRT